MNLTADQWITIVNNLLNILLVGLPTLLVAILAFKSSKHAVNEAKNSTRIAKYNNQIYSDELLFNTRSESRQYMFKIADEPQKSNPVLIKLYQQTVEDMLNAYELSCGLYLDDAIDKDRFKKIRKREIITLKESKDSQGNFTYPTLNSDSHQFRALQKVYESFRDNE